MADWSYEFDGDDELLLVRRPKQAVGENFWAIWITPKALANSSPGLLQPWDLDLRVNLDATLKELRGGSGTVSSPTNHEGSRATPSELRHDCMQLNPRVVPTMGCN